MISTTAVFTSHEKYSVNLPIFFNTTGGKSVPVFDFRYTMIIILSKLWVFSTSSAQSLLFCLIVWNDRMRCTESRRFIEELPQCIL